MGLSPMMEHWKKVKAEYPGCIVFYRLGDFYEMFFDDAVKASSELDLTLTGRDCGTGERAPMCGVPYHAADVYLQKLVEKGYRVAVCEQLSDPKASKGMVDRDVIRVVTAGTVTENNLLDEKKNNFIVCAAKVGTEYAFAWADITTGSCSVSPAEDLDALFSELVRLSPAEIVSNDAFLLEVKGRSEWQRSGLPEISCYLPWAFGQEGAAEALREQFHASVEALGLAGGACIGAAGALVAYLKDTQKRALANLTGIRIVHREGLMKVDATAFRNLDILKNNADGKRYGSLLWLLDKTSTYMGARKLNAILSEPIADGGEIGRRHDAVEELFRASVVRMSLAETLKGVKDIERLAGRISNGNLQPGDCLALSSSLAALPNLKFLLTGFTSAILTEISEALVDTKEICALLDAAISPNATTLKEGNYIRTGYNDELDGYRNAAEQGRKLIGEFETRERERTGIRTLKVGYNRVFGYYIEVTNTFRDRIPYLYVRKQTLANGERYTCDELKELEEKLLGSAEKAERLQERLYAELLEVLSRNLPVFLSVAAAVARLDVAVSLASVAKEYKYVRPVMGGDTLRIVEGRHPVVERIVKERFVPNDCLLDGGENRTLVITGPNMAGKSTYLRQTALIVFLAHIGSFVPAKQAEIPYTDAIFTRIGASDNLILDRSTFMVEMTEVANILRNATPKSLLILDEVGRGTSTFDGLSIAWAVIEKLTEGVRAKTLFATHYHELTELEGKLAGVKNYRIGVREIAGSIVFLRKIVRGGASRSFGVEVASLAGVPADVTARAKAILRSLEKRESGRIGEPLPPEPEEEEQGTAADLIRELEELDVDSLSPRQALALISEWKEKLS